MATWLITGAGSGLGRETARYAIENGDQVAVTSRSKEKLQNLVELAPERVLPLALEVRSLPPGRMPSSGFGSSLKV
ncbi:SDR family NAD(P)-dependent oxidoreductase [Limosilactobacillus fermentum]|uniref:SDR family NAD(P)-dependent oxidoreductase n=1 Tax=Limosilactobacillus fermentum TaxID=1613 RepID=UPI003B685CDE